MDNELVGILNKGIKDFSNDMASTEIIAQRIHDAGYRKVPSVARLNVLAETIIEKRVGHHSAQDIDCPVCFASQEVAQAIHDLMRGGE